MYDETTTFLCHCASSEVKVSSYNHDIDYWIEHVGASCIS